MEELEKIIAQIAATVLTKVIISKPAAKTMEYKKIVIERKKDYFQAAKYTEKQVFHDNVVPKELKNYYVISDFWYVSGVKNVFKEEKKWKEILESGLHYF